MMRLEAGAVLIGVLLAIAGRASAMCDVIPQPETSFRGEAGSLNRVFASPGDVVVASLDNAPAGCEAGATFAGPVQSTFDVDLEGWFAASSTFLSHSPSLGNPGGALLGYDIEPFVLNSVGSTAFGGDWTTMGVSGVRWDQYATSFTFDRFPGTILFVVGPGGLASYEATSQEIQALPRNAWGSFEIPISTSGPTGNWLLQSGSWSALMSDVQYIAIRGELADDENYRLDNVVLQQSPDPTPLPLLLYEPPMGPASAVVLGTASAPCSSLASALASCQTQLGGGAASCVDGHVLNVSSGRVSFTLPDAGFAGPVSVAITPAGQPLPCGLATHRCADLPGADPLVCVDEIYAGDGTCETQAANLHPKFPGFTALPPRNDFAGICASGDPSIPCTNTGADVRFTTDAAGNVLVPIDWRGVLVPGTLPIPRLVRASASVPAFLGTPPEPTQVPGAPVRIPGLAFLESYSPKGLRVDPLFNPLFGADEPDTELFGSADAELGVVRILRRSPLFRECTAGDRQALPCFADFECPNGACGTALCRGGASDGAPCGSDAACPGGTCGSGLFDFSDRYSNGGIGPVLLTSAEYDAEAQNPAAIDGLVATDDVFMFVRSEPLEGADLNADGDATDPTVVTVRDAATGDPEPIGGAPGSLGIAGVRTREAPFSFPAVVVEDDLVAFFHNERDEAGTGTGQGDVNGDGDDIDTILRVVRLEPGGPVELTATAVAAEPLPVVADKSIAIENGLVFFRVSETANVQKTSAFVTTGLSGPPDDDVTDAFVNASGRFVAFVSAATNIVAGDTNGSRDAFLWDRDPDGNGVFDDTAAAVSLLTVDSAGNRATCPSSCSTQVDHVTADGRFAVFRTSLAGLDPADPAGTDAFIRDRDTDADGILDEPGAVSTQLLSRIWGSSAGGNFTPAFSADGSQALLFTDQALVPGDVNGVGDFYGLDRDSDGNGVLDEPGTVVLSVVASGDLPGFVPGVPSPNLRFVSWARETTASSPGFPGGLEVLDRDTDEDGVFDEPGETSISLVLDASPYAISAGRTSDDGRRMAFTSGASLAPGPPGGPYLLDRDPDEDGVLDEPEAIDIQNYASDGIFESIRFIPGSRLLERTFRLPTQPSGVITNAIIDPLTGIDQLFSSEAWFGFGNIPNVLAASPRALHVANLDFNEELAVDGIDVTDLSADRNADGDVDDDVLVVLDGRATAPAPTLVLGPAGRVALSAAGDAAFLWREAGDGVDRNGDGDAADEVVHVWRAARPLGGAAVNLGLAADRVAVSSQIVAALVSERDEQALLNGDGDFEDRVVHVNDLATGTSGTWQNLFMAADAVQASGPYVAFTVPEADQGASLNGDGDQSDRVLRIYDTSTGTYLQLRDELDNPITGLAVDDFVLGDQVVAFRVNELGQGQNLNGVAPPVPGGAADADLLDSVIHVADLATGTVYNGMQAAIPCPVEACDPRVPYRVVGAKVTHLTLEAEQGGNDLDQNGDGGTGLVLQHFNISALQAGGGMGDACDLVGGALGGICTSTAESCAGDGDCSGGGTCFFPPGGCLFDSGVACFLNDPVQCTASQFCAPVLGLPGQGTCQEITGPCLTDAECAATEVCIDDGANPEQLFASVSEQPDGRQRFVSVGRCSDGDGSCANDADCNEGAFCQQDVTVIATAADPDADGLADPIDNCPDVANGDQRDVDGDGIGDACDRQSCGNGVQEYTESCDDGNLVSGDGCSDLCALEGATPACSNGLDDDGDGLVDFVGGDTGCDDALDASERTLTQPCDDGRDNDGDYRVDFPADVGCRNPEWVREDPACENGLDDDGDGFVDWDGAGLGEPDGDCRDKAFKNSEVRGTACGLGFEPVLALGALAALRAARRRRTATA